MGHHGPFSTANCNKLPEGTLMYIASWSDGICLSDMAIDHESLMGMSHRIGGGVETSHVWWHPKENIRTSPVSPLWHLNFICFSYAFHMVFIWCFIPIFVGQSPQKSTETSSSEMPNRSEILSLAACAYHRPRRGVLLAFSRAFFRSLNHWIIKMSFEFSRKDLSHNMPQIQRSSMSIKGLKS